MGGPRYAPAGSSTSPQKQHLRSQCRWSGLRSWLWPAPATAPQRAGRPSVGWLAWTARRAPPCCVARPAAVSGTVSGALTSSRSPGRLRGRRLVDTELAPVQPQVLPGAPPAPPRERWGGCGPAAVPAIRWPRSRAAGGRSPPCWSHRTGGPQSGAPPPSPRPARRWSRWWGWRTRHELSAAPPAHCPPLEERNEPEAAPLRQGGRRGRWFAQPTRARTKPSQRRQ